MRIIKKFLLILLSAILIVAVVAIPASANPKEKSDLPTEGVMSSDPLHGSSESTKTDSSLIDAQATATSGLIMKGACSISNAGNGNVEIYGYTQTFTSVSSIKVTVYLQKWTGSQWIDVTGVTTSGSNTDYISVAKTIAVTPGYYYRTRAVHTATSGTTSDNTTSTTSYIYL